MERVMAAVAAAAVAWGCTPGAGQQAATEPAAGPRVLGSFEGVLDPATGGLALRAPGGGPASNQLTLVDGDVTIQTVGGTSSAANCAGNSFEGAVRVTNNSAGTLQNVYAQIYEMSQAGREACNGDPDNGSATSTAEGFWNYGDLAPAASATRTWRLQNPDTTSYTFRGHVFTVASPGPTPVSSGSGKGWAATIQTLYLDSNGTHLTVRLKFNPIDGVNNNIWILVDDTSQSGLASLGDPTSWGSLGLALAGSAAGSTFEFAYSGNRGDLATNRAARKWTGPATSADATAGLLISQDNANGFYTFSIPYGSIGAGASPTSHVRVYALYGLNTGIHSAAPEQGAAQVALMNGASGGLTELDAAAPDYVLK